MTMPAAAPTATLLLRRRTPPRTMPQKPEIARCAGTAAARSGPRRFSCGRSIDPAATVASNGSRRVARAVSVEGAPLTTAATIPVRSPSLTARELTLGHPLAGLASCGASAPVQQLGRGAHSMRLAETRQELFQQLSDAHHLGPNLVWCRGSPLRARLERATGVGQIEIPGLERDVVRLQVVKRGVL